MQSRNNYHRCLWLLSGTGEGPQLAKAFLLGGWKVSVSVVSEQAAMPYSGMLLDNLWIGELAGESEIQGILKQGPSIDHQFELVIDATHPFALKITSDLHKVCLRLSQKLVRLNRTLISPSWANYVQDVRELSGFSLNGEKLLFAIGSRHLRYGVASARQAGAISFARILSTPESIKEALLSQLPSENIAVIRPCQGTKLGNYEEAICKRWSISGIVCRQSGGLTQKVWQGICERNKIRLWLVKRPEILGINIVEGTDRIIERYVNSVD